MSNIFSKIKDKVQSLKMINSPEMKNLISGMTEDQKAQLGKFMNEISLKDMSKLDSDAIMNKLQAIFGAEKMKQLEKISQSEDVQKAAAKIVEEQEAEGK